MLSMLSAPGASRHPEQLERNLVILNCSFNDFRIRPVGTAMLVPDVKPYSEP